MSSHRMFDDFMAVWRARLSPKSPNRRKQRADEGRSLGMFGARCQASLTLVLTAVAYKYIVAQMVT